MNDAIIFTGLLRCIQVNLDYISMLKDRFDIYFCVSGSDSSLEELKLAMSVGSVIDLDESQDDLLEQKRLLDLSEGVKLLQWQKLKVAAERIGNLNEYERIFKFRTDIEFNDALISEIINLEIGNNEVFMFSDLAFGCMSKVFITISNFYEGRETYYGKFPMFLDVRSLSKHDHTAAKFHWLYYPLSIEKYVHDYLSNKGIDKEDAYIKLVREAARFERKSFLKEPAFSRQKNSETILFSSEGAFLHFLLSKDLIVKAFGNSIKLIEGRFYDENALISRIDSGSYSLAYSLIVWAKDKELLIFKSLIKLCLKHGGIGYYIFLLVLFMKKRYLILALFKERYVSR